MVEGGESAYFSEFGTPSGIDPMACQKSRRGLSASHRHRFEMGDGATVTHDGVGRSSVLHAVEDVGEMARCVCC